ncbi:hypothetical protein RI367_003536 [Sorochytrium milnesiophthora]
MALTTATTQPTTSVGGLRLWAMQWSALVRKHILVLLRSPIMLTLAILGPAIMMIVASSVASSLTSTITNAFVSDFTDPTPPLELKLSVCTNSPYCRPAYYYAPNDGYHASVVNAFAQRTGLTVAGSLSDGDIVGFATQDDMMDAFYRDARRLARRPAAMTITFTTFADGSPSSFADATDRLKQLKTTTYSIGVQSKSNYGSDPAFPSAYYLTEGTAAATKVALDAAIIAVRRAQSSGKAASADGKLALSESDIPDMRLSISAFPRLTGADIASAPASPQTMKEQVTSMVKSTAVAGQDKHQSHLGVLRKLSLFETAYWASLATVILGMGVLIAAFSVGGAAIAASKYYIFANTNLFVIFVLQLLFAVSLSALGLLCVAVISHPYATTMLTVLVLVACALTCFALDMMVMMGGGPVESGDPRADPVFAGEWFHSYASTGKAIGLSLLPFFHYGRVVAELAVGTAQDNFKARYQLGNLSLTHGPFNDTTILGYNQTDGSPIFVNVPYMVPSASLNLVWMLALFLVYILLGCLLNQVVVGRSGGAKRPFAFARGGRGTVDSQLAAQSRANSSVIVDGMTKQFGKLTAVKGISMTMRKGRCLALLGHNGAGKSTLINMLSGLLSPTSGNAYVFGHALTGGASPIQRVLGTCPQDDIQYPQLSAREHLRLYSRFKGVPASELKEYIDERLDLVGLLGQADQPVGEFSGGMKRRLSIVSAGIGSPQFIILDEPTTGMDPINRRKVWQYIARLKRDCVLLLTSHSMEETDALGDDICIIDHGEVQATGTSLELKNAHGTGYQINMLTWQGRADELRAFVTEALPQAHISASTATSLSVVVGREDMGHLPAFLSRLQTTMRLPESERVVKDWGIQNASLEQVFLQLTRKVEENEAEQKAREDLAAEGLVAADEQALPKLAATFKLPTQIWAVITKNAAFQRKQRKANILFVLIVCVLLGALYVLLPMTMANSKVCQDGYLSFMVPPLPQDILAGASGPGGRFGQMDDQPLSCDLESLKNSMKKYQDLCAPSTGFQCDLPDYGGFKKVSYVDNPSPQIWVQGANDNMLAIMRNQSSLRYVQSPALSTIASAAGQDPSPSALTRPFDLVSIADSFGDRVLAAQKQMMANAKNARPNAYCSPMMVTNSDDASSSAFQQNQGGSPGTQNGILNFLQQMQGYLSGTYGSDLAIHHVSSAVSTTYAQMLVGDGESIQSNINMLQSPSYPDTQHMLAVMFMLFTTLWLFPMYLLVPFAEREDRLFAYFKVNGLSTLGYWVGNYVFCMLSSLIFVIALVIAGKLYFPNSALGLLILVMLLGVHSTIGLAFLYASVAQASVIARLIAYLVPVLLSLPSVIVVFTDVFGASAFTSTWACLFPPIALAFALRTTLQNFDLGLLVGPCLMMLIVGLVCIGVSVLIALASERAGSVWAFIPTFSRRTRPIHTGDSEATSEAALSQGTTDTEVLDEIKRVDNTDKHNASFAVKIQHLSKYYGTFAAVDDLTLGMDKGECFGLLGPNGSGKTTTVNMLGGTLAPSQGSATVGGFDIRDPRLPGVLGLCPQENRVMKDLTVEENLLFFARVRGANKKLAQAYARQAASIVGLTGAAYTRAAEHLSGGMRRRLSIAVALIGLPPVIILDEPTTGLDPGNRMHIWDIIAKIRDRREHCIILISHLMEEVDALTSRIGIMAAGSLRCLGNQVSLKNRFASGYTLYVQMNVSAPTEIESVRELHQAEAAHIDRVAQFVHSQVCSDALLRTGGAYNLGETAIDPQSRSWTASFQFRLPGSVDLARVFTKMEQGAAQLGVVEWSLNQSSLEDVFVEVATPYIK